MADGRGDAAGVGCQLCIRPNNFRVPARCGAYSRRCSSRSCSVMRSCSSSTSVHRSVRIGPADERNQDLPGPQFDTECIGQGFDCIFRCVVGAGAWCGEQATDGRDEYDPSLVMRVFSAALPCVTAICEMTLTSNCLVRSSSDNPPGPLTTMPALLTTPFNSAGS